MTSHSNQNVGGEDNMPKYRVDVTLEGYIEIEAESETEAREHGEDGFSIDQFQCEDTEIGDIALIKDHD